MTFFQTPERIARVHRNTPRFGRPNDINRLLLGNFEQEGSDYVVGVVSSSIAIAVTVTVWFVILLVLKCLGPDRVGLFSGKLPPQNKTYNQRKSEATPTTAPTVPRLPSSNKQQQGGEQRRKQPSKRNKKSKNDASDLPPNVIAALAAKTLVSQASAEPNANDNQKRSSSKRNNKKSKNDVRGLPSDVVSALAETTLVSDPSVEREKMHQDPPPREERSSSGLVAARHSSATLAMRSHGGASLRCRNRPLR